MMIRESVQVLICLSVMVSMSASLHLVRDAYHRPINELNTNNNLDGNSIIYDSTNTKRIPNTDLSIRATRNPLSNNLKYHEQFPSSLSSSSSVASSAFGSSSNSSPSSTLPFSVSLRSGPLARSSVTDSNGSYRGQKQVRFDLLFLRNSIVSYR